MSYTANPEVASLQVSTQSAPPLRSPERPKWRLNYRARKCALTTKQQADAYNLYVRKRWSLDSASHGQPRTPSAERADLPNPDSLPRRAARRGFRARHEHAHHPQCRARSSSSRWRTASRYRDGTVSAPAVEVGQSITSGASHLRDQRIASTGSPPVPEPFRQR